MARSPAAGPLLTTRQLNRALLARQWLLERHDAGIAEAVEHLVGLQAQSPDAPYVGLWSRLERFDPYELGAMLERREVVRIGLLRATLHLVTARDCLPLRAVVQPVLDRYATLGGNSGHRIDGVDLDALAAALRALIEEAPATTAELAPRIAAQFPEFDPKALAAATSILVPAVHVPPRGVWRQGGQPRMTSAESWLGQPVAARDPSPDHLVRRYLAAFGPATVQDAQAWCGLTRLDLAFERLRPELATFVDGHGRQLFDLPDAPRPDPDTPAPPRLVAEFDDLTLSHADRTRIVSDDHRQRLMTRNGIVAGTVLVDGFVRGMWGLRREGRGGPAVVAIQPFAAIPSADRAALRREGRRVLSMTDPGRPHQVVFDPVDSRS